MLNVLMGINHMTWRIYQDFDRGVVDLVELGDNIEFCVCC